MTATLHSRLPWRTATVVEIRPEAPLVVTLALSVPGWPGHVAGQHVDLRLTAPDGYHAERSYSIASAPGEVNVEVTVQHVTDGEVSTFLVGEAAVGDTFELRGPIGQYFSWEPGEGRPLLLVGGGSGIVPLMAMLRHRAKAGDGTPVHLLYSARAYDGIIYREELDGMVKSSAGFVLTYTLTREPPSGWVGERRRIDRAMLKATGLPGESNACAFVCGPTPLVEQVSADLVALGYADTQIKTERFGPTGAAQ